MNQNPPKNSSSSKDSGEKDTASHFPSIEKLLQTEDFDTLNKNFAAAYESLEKIGKGRGGIGKSQEARKAMKAIERTLDLLRELLKLKYKLSEGGDTTPHEKK